jgi:hypothetical protein
MGSEEEEKMRGSSSVSEDLSAMPTRSETHHASGLRPEVVAFAEIMERELRANDFKGGWKEESPDDLLEHLEEEVRELSGAIGMLAAQRRNK